MLEGAEAAPRYNACRVLAKQHVARRRKVMSYAVGVEASFQARAYLPCVARRYAMPLIRAAVVRLATKACLCRLR